MSKTIVIQSNNANKKAGKNPKQGKTLKIETFIISYPKSGRTWLRSILGKYLQLKYQLPEQVMLKTEQATHLSNLPIASFEHDGSAMLEKKTSQELNYSRQKYAESNVILLGRNLKDTLVSAYFQATKRINVFDGSLSEFIRTDQFGIEKLLAFYDVWNQNKTIPKQFSFVSYENLHQDPINATRKILAFMGEKNIDEDALQSTIDYCAFDNMQKLEKQNAFGSNIMKAGDSADPESFKVRKGKVGGYTEYLSEEDEAYIDQKIQNAGFSFDLFNELET